MDNRDSGLLPSPVMRYFCKDGALFRVHPGYVGVGDVLTPDGWKPYTGSDPIAPIVYGDHVTDPREFGFTLPKED